ncbi:MAG: hypothetical protein HOO00_09560 [Rhodospirillaceae bacterium]|mgnify:CR=1 FL=1|jgi:hypothetical protein|nr:hypothetical protein [Rhodospirillaceae bacterium]MBT5374030.1 hypothetical protein [Rhodospirillaceae bacterium]MBT5660416.1 hypothetical protein [Rhodospirillaceae bacterium]MBT5752987.1 hypothetical protein [Rhodospirillaceae bacterium]
MVDSNKVEAKKITNELKIESAESYLAAMRALNKKNRPPAVLRLLMSAFESYRQARKIGWSRPWNKYGVKTFRSYRLDFTQDTDLIALARDILKETEPEMPEAARRYVKDLLDDGPEMRGQLMGFIFFHEIDGTYIHEGATLSFGRKIKKRYRDRLDFVFEAPIRDRRAGPFERMRIFVDPFQGVKPPLWEAEYSADLLSAAQAAFQRLRAVYTAWESVEGRSWDHWTSAYIDHFGPRRHYVENSNFPISEQESAQLLSTIEA